MSEDAGMCAKKALKSYAHFSIACTKSCDRIYFESVFLLQEKEKSVPEIYSSFIISYKDLVYPDYM